MLDRYREPPDVPLVLVFEVAGLEELAAADDPLEEVFVGAFALEAAAAALALALAFFAAAASAAAASAAA